MVKKKSTPKQRQNAGYAARTAAAVHDSTRSLDSSMSEEAGGENRPTTSKIADKMASQKLLKTKKKNSKIVKRKAPGLEAMRQINQLQKTTNLLIPRSPFIRLVKELILNRAGPGIKVTAMSVDALREAAEAFLVNVFEDSYLLAMHAKRVTLFPRDIKLLITLKHEDFFSDLMT